MKNLKVDTVYFEEKLATRVAGFLFENSLTEIMRMLYTIENKIMQFQVPQFIDVEDRIFGPLTLKQFIYLAGGAGASAALFVYLPWKIVSILLILPIAAFSLALAFYKMNNKPFIDVVQSAFYYLVGGKLYIWKKTDKKPESKLTGEVDAMKSMLSVPKISESKLKDLTWSLDIKENLNPVSGNE